MVASPIDISHKSFSSSPTLGAANMVHRKGSTYSDSPLIVQATTEGVFVLEYDPAQAVFQQKWEWKPGMGPSADVTSAAERSRQENVAKQLIEEKVKIVHASFSPSQIALALHPKWFLLLNMDERGSPVVQRCVLSQHISNCTLTCPFYAKLTPEPTASTGQNTTSPRYPAHPLTATSLTIVHTSRSVTGNPTLSRSYALPRTEAPSTRFVACLRSHLFRVRYGCSTLGGGVPICSRAWRTGQS